MTSKPNTLGDYTITLVPNTPPMYENFLQITGVPEPKLRGGFFWFGKAFIIAAGAVIAITRTA